MQESLDNVSLTQLQSPPKKKKIYIIFFLKNWSGGYICKPTYTTYYQESESSLQELWQYISLQANFKVIQDSQRYSFSVLCKWRLMGNVTISYK